MMFIWLKKKNRKKTDSVQHAEPTATYTTEVEGEEVAVRRFAPGATGGEFQLRADYRDGMKYIQTMRRAQHDMWVDHD